MGPEKKAKRVLCVRDQTEKSAEEHLGCPYCFGKSCEVVVRGRLADFCDFDPAKDPVSFGFPEKASRNSRG